MQSVAQVEDEQLIFVMMEGFVESAAKHDEFSPREFAEENAELGMIAVIFKGLKDAVSAFIVGDIVRKQVASSGHCQRSLIV